MSYDEHETAHISEEEKRLYDQWSAARQRVVAFFSGLRKSIGYFSDSDVSVLDDMMAPNWIRVEIADFSLLDPEVIDDFRALIAEMPRMLVTIRVCHPDPHRKDWPGMGLTICDGKIRDGLKREYLPAPYNAVRYTNSRPENRSEDGSKT